jgi:hypothetical protein
MQAMQDLTQALPPLQTLPFPAQALTVSADLYQTLTIKAMQVPAIQAYPAQALQAQAALMQTMQAIQAPAMPEQAILPAFLYPAQAMQSIQALAETLTLAKYTAQPL